MNSTLKYLSVLVLLSFTVLFNIGLIDIRFNEISYLLGKIASHDEISNTFGIIAKYELIKKRMVSGEEKNSNYELEAKIQALTSGRNLENNESFFKTRLYQLPLRLTLNSIRFLLGKTIINPKEDDKVIEILEIAYFWERNRKYKEALDLYDEVLATSNVEPRIEAAILVHKAFCYSMISNYDKAKQAYEMVINRFPDTDAGILSWKLLDFIQSMEIERDKIEKTNLSRIEKARPFYLLMDFRNAIKNYSSFLGSKNNKNNLIAEARYFKGRAHEELGETDDAIIEYRIVMKIDKKEKWGKQANRRMLMLGEFYDQKEQIAQEARRKLEEYQDNLFAENVDKYKDILSKNSIKSELLKGSDKTDLSAIPNDSIINMIDQIGKIDLTGDTDEKENKYKKINKQNLRQQGLSEAEIHELKRKSLLVQNPYRRPGALKQVIDKHTNELKYIYNKRLRAGIKIQGKMIVRIKINADGNIVNTEVLNSDLGDQKFENDIVQRIQKWKFKAIPDSLGELTINYPFEFYEEM